MLYHLQVCNAVALYAHMFICLQEYVNELAQSLIDIDKNPQDVVAADKIKRLCNEAVSTSTMQACMSTEICCHQYPEDLLVRHLLLALGVGVCNTTAFATAWYL